MSAISSVGSSLSQWLQQLTGTQSIPAATAAPPTTTTQDPFDTLSAQSGSGHHHHHHGGFAKKVESAVTTALQNAPPGSDPNQVIKDAITQALQAGKPGATTDPNAISNASTSGATPITSLGSSSGGTFALLLQAYGVTGQQFQQDLQSALAAGATNSSSTTATGIASASDTAFSQLLQTYGVSPQQFQQDLQAAISGASSGGINFATLFKSFPPGSLLQATG